MSAWHRISRPCEIDGRRSLARSARFYVFGVFYVFRRLLRLLRSVVSAYDDAGLPTGWVPNLATRPANACYQHLAFSPLVLSHEGFDG